MDIKPRVRYSINPEINSLKEIYPHNLQFYDIPPTEEIPLTEFQQLGLDRLKVLQLVESICVRSDLKNFDDRKREFEKGLRTEGLKTYVHLLSGINHNPPTEIDIQHRRIDRISHFILRLAYCENPDQRQWFLHQEVELFRFRFCSLSKESVEQMLDKHKLNCERVSLEEKSEIEEQLTQSTSKIMNIDTVDFYKVAFQKVLDLVKTRKVYIRKGIAYIPHTELTSLFVSHFRTALIKGLEGAKECLKSLSGDERLMSYLKNVPGSFSGMSRVIWSNTTTPIEKLEELSRSSYPMCMRVLHEGLKTHHHLKNVGRMQYALFVKGIGVTMEDALTFFRTEFIKKPEIDVDKFEKKYSYEFRYFYGKEGQKRNYTPLGCQKIISFSVGNGEYHGCPYKTMDRDSLRQKLSSYGLPSPDITEIVELAKTGQYLPACYKYFNTVHNRYPDKPYMHPNGYYMESRGIANKVDEQPIDSPSSQKLTPNRFRTNATPTQIKGKDNAPCTPNNRTTSSMTPSRKTNTAPPRQIIQDPPNIEEMLENDLDILQNMEDF